MKIVAAAIQHGVETDGSVEAPLAALAQALNTADGLTAYEYTASGLSSALYKYVISVCVFDL